MSSTRPAAHPASASSIAPGARATGRWAEVCLLVIALIIGLGGFVLTALNRTGSSPAQILQLGGALVAVAVVVHLWVRRTAPWADPVLLPTAVALNGLGLAMIQRLDLSYARLGQDHDYAPKQAMWTGIGVALFCAVLVVRDYRLLRRWDRWAMWLGLAFLVLPFIPGLGQNINGAQIWIRLGPMSFQPAELTKVALAVFFASYLVSNRDNLALAGRRILFLNLPRARHLGPLMIVWGVSILVLVAQRDLGSSVLLFGLFVVTLYVATDRPSWLILGGLLFVPAAWFAATHLNHVQQRITAWMNAMDPSVYDAPGGSWQLVMGLFGMASGGVLGSGWGAGYPNLVTFANSDFIVASIGEELGLTGTLAILMLYLLLIERGLRTAMSLRDGFGKLLAVGLSFTIAIQVFVVVGGVTRLIPLTGLTTPFLAYGGSSLVANWMILALLVRLSDAARRPATTAPRFVDTAELPTGIRKHVLDAGAESDSPDAPEAVPDDGFAGSSDPTGFISPADFGDSVQSADEPSGFADPSGPSGSAGSFMPAGPPTPIGPAEPVRPAEPGRPAGAHAAGGPGGFERSGRPSGSPGPAGRPTGFNGSARPAGPPTPIGPAEPVRPAGAHAAHGRGGPAGPNGHGAPGHGAPGPGGPAGPTAAASPSAAPSPPPAARPGFPARPSGQASPASAQPGRPTGFPAPPSGAARRRTGSPDRPRHLGPPPSDPFATTFIDAEEEQT